MTRAVNDLCPWSGRPVSSDSLTTYREQTVGFCNPGCRDKFETATQMLDREITAQDPFPRGEQVEFAPYVPRYAQPLGRWQIEDMQLKVIGMTKAAEDVIEKSLIESAEKFTAEVLPAKRAVEGQDHKVGYVILHKGDMGAWLLIHWWAHGDILLSALAMAQPGTETFDLQGERHFHSCVWEQVAISHERDAWVELVMKQGGNLEDYLSAQIQAGYY